MKSNLKTMNNEPFTPFSKHEQSRCPRASTSERWTRASQGPDSETPGEREGAWFGRDSASRRGLVAGRGGLPRGPGGRALGGRGAMEAPAELLAALPALATALALLLAWLLLRRGAAPAPAPASAPERASPTEAPGAPAPPAPPEPSASEPAPAGPRQPERMTELGEPVAEEPVDKGRQVRTEFVVGSPVGHPRACRLNLPRKGRASGRQERRVPATGTLHPPLKWSWPLSLPPSPLWRSRASHGR